MPDVHGWIERVLPWYHAETEQKRDAASERVAKKSEVAQERADRVIREYRRAEAVSTQKGKDVGQKVSELRDAQETARQAGEAVIEEVEDK